MNSVLKYDNMADVLYVRLNNAPIAYSSESPNDGNLIINYGFKRNVVGIQMLAVSELEFFDWLEHPDRQLFATDLLVIIDEWMKSNIVRLTTGKIKL